MKKLSLTSSILGMGILCFLTCFCTLCLSSCNDEYDDTELWNGINDLENRLTSLEEWQKSVNTSISSLQSIIKALEDKDYVTGVTPLTDGSGYEISFLKSGKIAIKHGEKGEKGETGTTPIISVKQDSDGKYYWTVNGEWLLDSGNKIPVTGEKGDKGDKGDTGSNGNDGLTPHIGDNGNWWIGSTDTGVKAQGDKGNKGDSGTSGDNGLTPHIGNNGNWWIGTTDTGVKAQGAKGADAIAPQVRINPNTNEWETSVDGGTTWTPTGVKATGDSMFESVDNSNSDYVVITLENGGTLILPKIITDENTVHVTTAGGLQQAIQDAGIDAATATELIITGTLGNEDFTYLKNNFTALNRLNLSGLDITVLPERALQQMPIEEVILPKGLTEIQKSVFYGCTFLRSLDIPESVRTLGRWIVEGCDYLETVTLHNGLTTLSASTFYGCGIISIQIPGTVTAIPNWCFENCKNLERVYLHNNIASIGEGAFFKCESLQSFSAPADITSLSDRLFYGCKSLRSVRLHNEINGIGFECFVDCISLRGVESPNANGDLIMKFPDLLQTLGEYAFHRSGLENANMYDTKLTVIPAWAFNQCKNLSTISMPQGLTSIGEWAFYMTAAEGVELPATITTLGSGAFYGCKNMTQLVCKATTAPSIQNNTFSSEFKTSCTLVYPKNSDYSSWTSYFKKSTTLN